MDEHERSPLRSSRLCCRFDTPSGPVLKYGSAALFHPPLVRTAVKTAIAVGVVLTLIDHGSAILSGRHNGTTALEIALTFFVPYVVATYGAIAVSRVDAHSRI